jgi:hypothetical protein
MSTETRTQTDDGSADNWRAGAVGGIVGAIGMAALVLAMNTPTLAVAIPSLYLLAPPANVGAGLFVHVSHGAILGVVFAGVVGTFELDSTPAQVGAGVGWGVVTWVVLAALVMPVWLSVVGSPASPPLPNFAPPSLLWHAVYGVVLGGVYAAVDDRI